jgi:hypothetical protein
MKRQKKKSQTYFWQIGYPNVGKRGLMLQPYDRNGHRLGSLLAGERNLYVTSGQRRRCIRWDKAIEKLLA